MSDSSTPQNQEPKDAASLVEKYASSAPFGTFAVKLPGGDEIQCRYPERYADLRDFQAGLTAFWKKWSDVEDLPEDMREIAPKDFQEAYVAYLLHFYSVEPTHFDEANALRMLRNTWVAFQIKTQIEEAQRFVADAKALEEIDSAGKGLPPTP
jgi:hypothetical protein